MLKHLYLLCFLELIWLVIANASAPLEIGKVFNWTFPDESTQTMEFELSIPYNSDTPDPLRSVILTYVPFDVLTVYASLSNPSPNSTDNDYIGTSKDGSFERGIVWIDNLPLSDVTLYVSVSKITPDVSISDFGLNAEVPVSFSSFVVDQRNEVITEVLPWQTKWFLIEIPDEGEQYMSAFRAEFCDEAVGSVSMSLVFPETNTSDVEATLSVCGCDDTYVEDRSNNLISTFALKPTQMFILPEPAIDDPVYIGIFYGGPDDYDFTTSYSRRLSCEQRQAAARKRSATSSLPIDAPAFSVRLTMWGQELYPAIRTKYLKPDMVDKDLIANVDDTPFCDFWADDSFTAYVSKTEYASFDSSCFLETHSDLFTTYSAETLFGAGTYDRSVILRDFYKDHDVTEATTYVNFVHTHDLCGSYAYYHAEAPDEGWKHKIEWAPAAIGIVVILGFLFVVFFISTIILVLRLREYTRYRRIKD